GFQINQPTKNQVLVDRLSVWRQTHELVFTAVHLEAAVIGESGIQKAQRMRKRQMVGQADVAAGTGSEASGAPFPHPVQGENGCFFERTREESARRVTFMMTQKN